jgi:hypothetical protein
MAADGWTIIYKCIPNTPHTRVVPVQIAGSCKQHYPDVLAVKGDRTRIVEVEVQLSTDVGAKIIERFAEIRQALTRPAAWASFRAHVADTTGRPLPTHFKPEWELVICKKSRNCDDLVRVLKAEGIDVAFHDGN